MYIAMLMFYICIIIKSEKEVRKPDLPFHCKDVSEAGERKRKRAIIFQIALTHQREIEF